MFPLRPPRSTSAAGTGRGRQSTLPRLTQPLQWRRPRKIFVCAHGDLFAEGVPDAWIDRVFAVMALAPQHTMQVLTKRSARMRAYMTDPATPGRIARVPDLLATPAAVRWVSAEPLLGPIDFARIYDGDAASLDLPPHVNALLGQTSNGGPIVNFYGPGAAPRLDLIVVGDESGLRRRETNLDCVRSIRDQCAGTGTDFFLKQLHIGGRKIGLPVLDGVRHDAMPGAAR